MRCSRRARPRCRASRRARSPPAGGGRAGGGVSPDWRYLSARRLALFINASIERGTRWLAFEHNSDAAWKQALAQTEAFLDGLDLEGAFAGSVAEESYFVICD